MTKKVKSKRKYGCILVLQNIRFVLLVKKIYPFSTFSEFQFEFKIWVFFSRSLHEKSFLELNFWFFHVEFFVKIRLILKNSRVTLLFTSRTNSFIQICDSNLKWKNISLSKASDSMKPYPSFKAAMNPWNTFFSFEFWKLPLVCTMTGFMGISTTRTFFTIISLLRLIAYKSNLT